MKRIEIYDTTLRDGSQGEGVNFSLQDKLLITRRLDELGVDYIEGGYPLSNPKDFEYFQEARKLDLKHAKVAVSPGIGFGEYGEGYVRVALVENEHRIRQAARNVKKFLQSGTNNPPSDSDGPSKKKLASAK